MCTHDILKTVQVVRKVLVQGPTYAVMKQAFEHLTCLTVKLLAFLQKTRSDLQKTRLNFTANFCALSHICSCFTLYS